MTAHFWQVAGIVASLSILFLLSLIEGALIAASPVSLRMNLEKEGTKTPPLLALVLESKTLLFLPLHLGMQITMIGSTVLITCVCFERLPRWGGICAFGLSVASSVVFRQFLPRLLTQNDSEKKLAALLHSLGPLVLVCRFLSAPLTGMLDWMKRLHQETEVMPSSEETETSDEEIQAYLEIGENEGILEKEDAQMIQSVVEFGDTLVREVMTPRTSIAACDEDATMGGLRDTMVESRHSRIPIYRGDIDHIIGIAYIRQLLAEYSQGKETEPIASLIHPALFVPETKRVSALLKDLQASGDHTAIVIDEFGGVAGLVTIEDLVEEIVGEIHDKDKAKVNEIIEENPRSFIFRGSTELYHLEDLASRKFTGCDASTVAGLIVAHLGRIPAPGEEFDLEGLQVQILDADRKRIRRLRVQLPSNEAINHGG